MLRLFPAALHVRCATQVTARRVLAALYVTCVLWATTLPTAAQRVRHAALATVLLVLVRLCVLSVTRDIPELVQMALVVARSVPLGIGLSWHSSARCVLQERGRVLALLTAPNVLPVSTRGLPRLNVPNVRRERMLPLVSPNVTLA